MLSLKVVFALSSSFIYIILLHFLFSSIFVILLTYIDNYSFTLINARFKNITLLTFFIAENNMDFAKEIADYNKKNKNIKAYINIY